MPTEAWTAALETWLRNACVLEATARKPGNVHPQASFPDLTHADFIASAEAAAPVLSRTRELGVGAAVLEGVRETRRRTASNTNLGILLLLAPLAAVPQEQSLAEGIGPILGQLTRRDAEWVYEAIRLVRPGGLGRAASQDVSQAPSVTLLEAMRLAAERDTVAAQYATDFELVLGFGVPFLAESVNFRESWEEAVIGLHLALMARQPDTLIARKCGWETAELAAVKARTVLEAGWPTTEASQWRLAEFDAWLRADGNRRNPGTTADLVAACLFAAFRDAVL